MQDFIQNFLAQNKLERDYIPTIEGNLYFEGKWALRKLTNYTVLLLLATVIATYGVTSASSATVIGAMLVAPLMTPIMATTLALVRGQETRAAKSFVLTVISVLAVIVLAMLLSWPIPFIDFEGNSEIASRVAPGLSAMGVALAAGAAGAFANSRKEIGDSLPGVAISISLVPPLAVVGISLAHGQYQDAIGSLVLFITNFLAIVLAGSLVFWLSGANALNLSDEQKKKRRKSYLIAIGSSVIVLLMLGATSISAFRNSREQNQTQVAVEEWLGESTYEVVDIVVKYPEVTVTLAGEGDLAELELLGQALVDSYARGDDDLLLTLKTANAAAQYYPDKPPEE